MSISATWADLTAIEPRLADLADAIARATIPDTAPGYGRSLLAVEEHIGWLVEHHGRLTPEQADAAYGHAAAMVRRRIEVTP